MLRSSRGIPYWFVLIAVVVVYPLNGIGQSLNSDVAASIEVERNSEFYTFKALAENKTPIDYSLRYEYLVFKTDENNNVSRSVQANRFFLEGNQKKVLSSLTINYNVEGKVVIALLIYDKDDKPLGKARMELVDGGRTQLKDNDPSQKVAQSADQAKPNDGFFLQGLIVENTITKAGRDFYRYFYSDYYNRGIASNENIVIEEVPGRSRFTRVSVLIRDQIVWQFFAQPKKEFLKKMAATALNRSIAHLQRLQKQDKEQITRY